MSAGGKAHNEHAVRIDVVFFRVVSDMRNGERRLIKGIQRALDLAADGIMKHKRIHLLHQIRLRDGISLSV